MNDWPVSLLHKNTISSFHMPHVIYWLGCWKAHILYPKCCCWMHKCFFPEGRLRQEWLSSPVDNTVIGVQIYLICSGPRQTGYTSTWNSSQNSLRPKHSRGVNTSEPKPFPVHVAVLVPPAPGVFVSPGMNLGKPANCNTLHPTDPILPSGIKKTGNLVVMPDTQ